jgi:branched-chain amino acid transport system permease protein
VSAETASGVVADDDVLDHDVVRQGSQRPPMGGLSGLIQSPVVRRLLVADALILFAYWLWKLAAHYGYSVPPGVIVQGAVIGGLTSLISFGIVLVYRSNRIVNFASGELGAVPAALAVLLIVGSGLPYFLAMAIGLVTAVALGAVVEFLIIRRFFKSPRLILTVATIGIANLLAAIELSLPDLFDLTIPPQSFPSPFDFSFEIAPIVFRGNDLIAMLAVPVVIAGLLAFFRYTNVGIAVRASAESADRASLLGVPVKRVQTIVWILATVLATVAILLRAGIVGLPIGQVLGPAILLRALAAAVIGGMERLPIVFAAAVGLGIVEQAVVYNSGQSLLVDPILFAVIVVALLLQRRRAATRFDEATAAAGLQAAEVRPIPRELAKLPEVVWSLRGLRWALITFLVLLPVVLPDSRLNLVQVVMIFGIIGISLVILTGWAGQVSLGQFAFVGVGAAVAGALSANLGWDIAPATLVAGLAGAATAVIIGIPALRLRGLFLAVTTLAFALATSSYLLNPQFMPWLPTERVGRPPLLGPISVVSETRYYYLTVLALGAAYAAARGLRTSRTGRVLIATRENERAVASFGISPVVAKLTAFAMSGFLAAYAGALFVYQQQSLEVTPYLPEASLRVFAMVVIGGLGSLGGALLGAVYLQGTTYFLPATAAFLASGIGVLVILVLLPAGLGSLLYRARDRLLREVAQRHSIIVPSLFADMAVPDATTPEPVLASSATAAGGRAANEPDSEPERVPS